MLDNPQSWPLAKTIIYDVLIEARRSKKDEPDTMKLIYNKLCESGFINEESVVDEQSDGPWITAVDHISHIVSQHTIRKWAWFYIDVLGGKLTQKIDDAIPKGKSSMMLWEIDFGKFAFALVAGIDRKEKSHVSVFHEKHGDRIVQHIGFRPRNDDIEGLVTHLEKYGMNFQGELLTRPEGSGAVRQIFAWPANCDSNPAEVGFDEFQARPAPDAIITFSEKTAADLYEIAQNIMRSNEAKPMINWSHMPDDWEP